MAHPLCSFAAVLVLTAATLAQDERREITRYFVAVNGSDDWSGKLAEANQERTDGPFATLERARDEIRRLKKQERFPRGGVSVELRGGVYRREKALELTAEDSGRDDAPIAYQAHQGEQVHFLGGQSVDGWKPVTDPAVLERLDETARDKVLQADLRALGVADYGSAAGGGIELFFQDQPMTLARWPNQGFVRIGDCVGGAPVDVRGTKGDRIGKFIYDGDRPNRWIGENDVWLHGYWFWDWSDQRQKVASIDPQHRIITLAPPHHGYGYRKGQWYYAFNVLAELDSPGEWYLDRENGILYFWPPAPVEDNPPVVSVASSLVTMNNTSHVAFRGLILEAARSTAVTIAGGERNRIDRCTIRNLGGWAVTISGGQKHAVVGCNIYRIADGSIELSGGDRKTLTPAGHEAINNHIHDYGRWNRMYRPAISLSGVGLRAAHNLIHDAPHQAVSFSGNDHIIELNEIHHVCTESNDAGAIYSGRDWTMRGTIIRHNFLHHINGLEGRGCVGVYLDDMYCGTEIIGNVFYQVTRAAFIGGGRDNVVQNNIFVDCSPALHIDARAMGWASDHVSTTMTERLLAMPYKDPLWSKRYPTLVAILEDEPAAPKGNRVAQNVCYGGRWDEIEAKARPLVTFENNLLDQDPQFVDAATMNFQLKDSSPAYRLGFRRIPVDEIGLRIDEN